MQKIILLLITFYSVNVLALKSPSSMRNSRSGLVTQTLGATCFTLNLPSDAIPCNPAYMAKERDKNFRVNAFVGNNINYLHETSDLLNNKADAQTVEKLFGERKSSEFEASLEGSYLSEKFAIAYSPFNVSYYSLFQNQALPEITLFASLEDSARMQIASYVQDDIYLGLQFRYLHRKVIATRFFLTDILAETQNKILSPQEQTYIFLEPGFLYSNEKSDWRPEVSVNILNVGFKSGDKNLAAEPLTEYHIGGAFSRDFEYGRWGWLLDLGWNKETESASEIFTLGSYFEMGILKVFASLAEHANGAGFLVNFDSINVGMSYSAKSEYFDINDSNYSRRLYFLIGADI